MQKALFRIGIATCCVLLASSAYAWNGKGHRTVALIAFRSLKPGTVDAVIDALKSHPNYAKWKHEQPQSLSTEDANAYLLMCAATWPDEIRHTNLPLEERRPDAHFIDYAYPVPANRHVPPEPRENDPDRDNILKMMKECVNLLGDSSADEAERAKAISWLIHLVGDIHQPLHCAKLYSDEFPIPHGDTGGNDFLVSKEPVVVARNPNGTTYLPNLHSFWDDALGSHEAVSEVKASATQCMVHNKAEFAGDLAESDRTAWANASHKIAIDAAYTFNGEMLDHISRHRWNTNPQTEIPGLPNGYPASTKKIAERQVALAGYRLAQLFELHF